MTLKELKPILVSVIWILICLGLIIFGLVRMARKEQEQGVFPFHIVSPPPKAKQESQ